MKRRVICISLAALLFTGCSGKTKEEKSEGGEPVVPVEVAAVTQETMSQVVTAAAVLFPVKQANVMPKLSAPIRRFLVNRGDHVKEGQILATLESRDLAASAQESKDLYEQARSAYDATTGATMPEELTRAQADVRSAQQQYDAAKKLYDNRVSLVREGALAQKLADDAKVATVQAQSLLETAQRHLTSLQTVGRTEQVRGGKAQVAAAKSRYQGAEVQLSYAEIRSPISGVISDRPLSAGEIANSGTALISVVDVSQVVARANIPVKEAALLRVGQTATITGQGGEVAGKVTVVSPAVNPSTTTVEVWVQAANPGELLKPGVTVQVAIRAAEIKDAMVVPAAAILSLEEGGEKVMVVGADLLAHERKIKAGVRDGEKVQLLEGATAGERVIVSGGLGLEDKAKVKIGAGAGEK